MNRDCCPTVFWQIFGAWMWSRKIGTSEMFSWEGGSPLNESLNDEIRPD
jgi:hypothetical protein